MVNNGRVRMYHEGDTGMVQKTNVVKAVNSAGKVQGEPWWQVGHFLAPGCKTEKLAPSLLPPGRCEVPE